MDDRVKKLEATVIELNSKIDTQFQSTKDTVTKLSAQFGSFKDELLQLLRLNRPTLPIVGASQVCLL